MKYNRNSCKYRRMALRVCCMAATVLLLSWVQVTDGLKSKVNIGFQQSGVISILHYLEKNAQIRFSYNRDDLERTAKLTIDKKVRTVEELLKEISAATGLEFKIMQDMIWVKPVPTPAPSPKTATATPDITGTVKAASGELLPGVSVKVKGTSNGILTDVNGRFILKNVPDNAVLEISYIGFETTELPLKGRSELSITLSPSVKQLEQVVVVGYGTQRKGNVTSAISSVKGETVQNMATNNPIDALQGRVAGLTVTNAGGQPGAAADVRIRGVGTFGSHKPLYVIDGTPGDPYYLNNNDIASMEVLKDGAAAAIYGSTSANGVILITTKKGKKGPPLIEFNSYYSFVNPTRKYNLLDADGYKKVHKMMYENVGRTPPAFVTKQTGVNTNWQDEILQQGTAENYNINLRGGGDFINYALSGDITNEKGTYVGSGFKKKTVRSRNEYKKDFLTIEANITYSETRAEAHKFNPREAYFQSPLLPVFDPAEKYRYALQVDNLPKYQNPLAADHYLQGYTNTQYFNANVRLSAQLYRGLKFVSNLNFINANEFTYTFRPVVRINPNDGQTPYANLYNQRSNYRERLMENLLYYDLLKGKHSLNIMAGYTAQEQTNDWLNVTADGKTIVRTVVDGEIKEQVVPGGFLDPSFVTIDGAKGGTFGAGGSRNKYVRLSTLGRINYAYDDKYMLQFSVRRDGSSKFDMAYRYGIFPSVSAGWNIQREPFMAGIKWLDMLKLRASYGQLGNESALGFYDHQTLMYVDNTWLGGYVQGSGGTPWTGIIAQDLVERKLRWETSRSTNAGFDFALLNNRLSGAFNFFNNVTDGLLITKEVAPSSGLNNPVLNVGKIRNRGWELEVTYSEKKKNWQYSITGVLSSVNNKVLSLANNGQTLYGTGLKFGSDHIANQTRAGKEIGAFYLYEADGIFQSDDAAANYKNKEGQPLQPAAKAGDIRFRDTNGDGVIDENDKSYQGAAFPSLEYGFNLSAACKGFDLALFFQGVAGNKIYNGNRFELEGMDAGRNFLNTTLNAWTPQNTNTDMPRAVLGDPNRNARESTRFLEKGDYLRLKTIQLGYTFSTALLKHIHVQRLRLYVGAQNILTFTKYSGLDPEIGRTAVLNSGLDRMQYPQNKKVMLGAQLSF
ncbi:TonB-dependent receptor [Chitinophaga pendula]|uniref:SusC/RagA family TonB-linked outer membrane protein n=1 Tax=Chitinophaga TaxID=79328 RepID=UPI000BAF85FB|nr:MULTISPECIES: TonB-dependent receptor [Chitinophaga]ASZ13580.1 SusC/RagA family TonB-linked outer membrane protein [Chitinophaga sp. MD30]UCJ08797.1 TonB-dependent receptor [Chitinophaga pendula]